MWLRVRVKPSEHSGLLGGAKEAHLKSCSRFLPWNELETCYISIHQNMIETFYFWKEKFFTQQNAAVLQVEEETGRSTERLVLKHQTMLRLGEQGSTCGGGGTPRGSTPVAAPHSGHNCCQLALCVNLLELLGYKKSSLVVVYCCEAPVKMMLELVSNVQTQVKEHLKAGETWTSSN